MKKTKIRNFFNNDKIVLYKNINDLSEKKIKYSNDNMLRGSVARKAEINFLNSTIIANFLINKHLKLRKIISGKK